MKLDDVKVEDVVWNVMPHTIATAERASWYYYIQQRRRCTTPDEYRSFLSRREKENVIELAIRQVSYFSVRVDNGVVDLELCTPGGSESIEDCRSAGVTRNDLVDSVLKGMGGLTRGRGGVHFPCSSAVLRKLIRHYHPRKGAMREVEPEAISMFQKSMGGRHVTPQGFIELPLSPYQKILAGRVKGGCVVSFWFEGCEDHYCYHVTEKGRDVRVCCLMDGLSSTQATFKDLADDMRQNRRFIYGPLSSGGATKELVMILLRAASKADKRFSRYATFLYL